MFYSYRAKNILHPTLFVFAPSLFSSIQLFCGGGGAGNAVCDACMCELEL